MVTSQIRLRSGSCGTDQVAERALALAVEARRERCTRVVVRDETVLVRPITGGGHSLARLPGVPGSPGLVT